MVMSPNNVESRQLEEGRDSDGTRALLQFPKQRFMYSIYGGRAASDPPVRWFMKASGVVAGRVETVRALGTRKASHVFEPPGEGGNLADDSVALAQAQIRPEPIVFM